MTNFNYFDSILVICCLLLANLSVSLQSNKAGFLEKSRTRGFLEKEETSYNKLSNKDSLKKKLFLPDK